MGIFYLCLFLYLHYSVQCGLLNFHLQTMTASITLQPLNGISFLGSAGELQETEHMINFI